MSVMRTGYGSEWHLRNFFVSDITTLNSCIVDAFRGDNIQSVDRIEWSSSYLELELPEVCGLDFLPAQSPVRIEWQQWWPQTGKVHNWDGVGRLYHLNGAVEWLLLEAKANIEELQSSTRAKRHGGLGQIIDRLTETKRACDITDGRDWTQGHYQYANRLAVLHFLMSRGIAARLVFIYCSGDLGDARRTCPACADEWKRPLADMKTILGLTGTSELEKRVHHIFLPVRNSTRPALPAQA